MNRGDIMIKWIAKKLGYYSQEEVRVLRNNLAVIVYELAGGKDYPSYFIHRYTGDTIQADFIAHLVADAHIFEIKDFREYLKAKTTPHRE